MENTLSIKERLKNRLIEIPVRSKAYREVRDLAEKINATSEEVKPLLDELVEKGILIEKKQYICPVCSETTIMDKEFLDEILENADAEESFECDNCFSRINPKTDTTGFIYYDVDNYDLLKEW